MGGDCVTYPILYEANETDFFSLGLGPIKTATEAFVIEERNGSFILEGKVLVDDEIYPLLQENRIIKADASPTLTAQRFRIKRIIPNHDGQAEIYAEHVSYLSQELPMKPEVSISGNASAALNAWKSAILDDNPFIVDSDIGTSNKTNWRIGKVENPRQALGGVEGSILDVWGGEYRFDNYHISLLKKRGTTANTILAYGRNITDFEQERNIMTTYTTVYPYAIYTDDDENEQIVTIDGYVVDCENINEYPNRNVLPVDFSNEFEHDEVPTKVKLKQLAQDYIKNNDIGIPKTSIKVSFLDLAQTADYADIATLETVELCDDVRVHYEKLGVDTTAKVIRTKWNVLLSAYDELEIGEKRTTLSSIINDTQTSIKDIENQTGSAIIAANGKNMIFHGLFGEDGLGEPTATRVGDMWYKPNGENTEFYIWDGTVWAFIMSTAKFDEINNKVDELQTATEQAVENANNAVEQANQAVAKVDSMDKAINTALEQSANALDQAQQAIKDANDLLTTVTDVQGTVTNISAVVDEINNQLAVKVSQTDFDKLKGTVDTQAVQISANAKEISLKASQSSVDTITDNVTSIQSELKTQAGSITAINSRVDGQQTQIGTLQSSYNGLSSTIANVESNILNSDYSNLIPNSKGDSTKGYVVWGGGNFLTDGTQIAVLKGTATTSYGIQTDYLIADVEKDITYTLQLDVGSYYYTSALNYCFLIYDDQQGNQKLPDIPVFSGSASLYTRSITFKPVRSGKVRALLAVSLNQFPTSTGFRVKNIMMFKGESSLRAWQPAYSDLATVTEMSNITQTVKDIQATVADKVSQAQFTILSNQVTTTVSDISGINSQITQLSDLIDMRVTKGDVIGQITTEAGRVLIGAQSGGTGNYLMITPDTTYIQNATIKSAHIADASITNAKIADATISSAKIISLDANKVTASTLSSIVSNTGNLNISGTLTVTTDNNGLTGTYDYGDVYGESLNPRYFVGTWNLRNRLLSYRSAVYELTSSSQKGSLRYYASSMIGPDYFKFRSHTNSDYTGLRSRLDMTSEYISMGTSFTDDRIKIYYDGGIALHNIHVGEINVATSRGYSALRLNVTGTNSCITLYPQESEQGVVINGEGHSGNASMWFGRTSGKARIWSTDLYNYTGSGSANLAVNSNGTLYRATSARKYKTDIQKAEKVIENAKKILGIHPVSWLDKLELQLGEVPQRYYGFIADEFDERGLNEVVVYGADGQVESLAYDRISMFHNVLLTEHEKEINQLKKQVSTLENQVGVLQAR
nr:phage tail spike protein [Enterococcus gallinarum]